MAKKGTKKEQRTAYSGIDQRAHERISNRTDGIPCDGKLAQFDSTSS